MPAQPSTTAEQLRFRSVIGHFATGVAVVTASSAAGPVGMTASALCSLSLDPLLLLVCFDSEARTLPPVRESGRFAVNVLRAGQEPISQHFASKLPEHEKFAEIGHTLVEGLPIIAGALAWLTCDVVELLPGGDHEIALGAVTAMDCSEGDPLVFFRGAYRGLA